ncbi:MULTISPECIES: cupin domain-containing protein [Clostridium]|uniref:Cupin n=1 Tax=Clostridium beijerinckii TaxID=1520 RepID=A0A1S9N8G0_CLOBE|nr:MULTISPECIES: cupin domain-containing protein [Clostridium]MBN7574856.1 cupin domain-containing protein [Clostridium beijerinckii]MBN7579749.1 cupin domain-containing protein [Clostridium beijerinckii]MBN7584620.1 cupin domain-containing protein [Clostridium beijerinckii]MBO0520490.1 cupin domain-containing protein [Clostridium beijerinckii]MZK53727.1 cupin domain-containing protein [Clostridium beijerinckii]
MDLESIKDSIVKNIYHISEGQEVELYNHLEYDEVFYCIKGEGFGVLDDSEIELRVGKPFVVPAGVLHSLRTDSNLYVASFLIPVLEQ